ncbi:hypothetical protein B0H19DRAFT_602391 [Mycena capillaripes]|nr:hypothetical protein B0H19DRAFT_602391 [Mycena capillaripes]
MRTHHHELDLSHGTFSICAGLGSIYTLSIIHSSSPRPKHTPTASSIAISGWSTSPSSQMAGANSSPSFPLPRSRATYVGYSPVPHEEGHLFVFLGMPAIPVFDTRRRKWRVIRTFFTVQIRKQPRSPSDSLHTSFWGFSSFPFAGRVTSSNPYPHLVVHPGHPQSIGTLRMVYEYHA